MKTYHPDKELNRFAMMALAASAVLFFAVMVVFIESESLYRNGTASGWYISVLKGLSISYA